MRGAVDHVAGQTFHGRKGAIRNAFRYGVDYVLLDAEADVTGPGLFTRNGRNMVSVHDIDHGGAPGEGTGARWVRQVMRAHQLPQPSRIQLLTQPRRMGHVFNPVSFWLCHGADGLNAVIAEVTNTFGERHSYLCHKPDLSPITPSDRLTATKIFHVSPFQPVEGGYVFRFDIRPDRVGIWIDYSQGDGGLIATLTGHRRPLTNGGILRAALRRPMGSRRVLALIHWQALKLWWKGARYRVPPTPPAQDVSRG
ncbi:MAG: cyclopropane-fatty-acyl-phospholipid synthase [Rhodobacteraceae bacterium]|nr:cyclopropane-fatty-acyl-phospholipid synthase [Paracoccaceae bacterium]